MDKEVRRRCEILEYMRKVNVGSHKDVARIISGYYKNPDKVMAEVRRMRDDGIPAHFSIDTGATVYVNTLPKHVGEVEGLIKELGIETIRCGVGGKATIVNEHLF